MHGMFWGNGEQTSLANTNAIQVTFSSNVTFLERPSLTSPAKRVFLHGHPVCELSRTGILFVLFTSMLPASGREPGT